MINIAPDLLRVLLARRLWLKANGFNYTTPATAQKCTECAHYIDSKMATMHYRCYLRYSAIRTRNVTVIPHRRPDVRNVYNRSECEYVL